MPVLNAWKRGNVMLNRAAILDKLFEVNPDSFNSLCLEVFHYQYQYNSVYREYCSLMHTDMAAVLHYTQIPFLPVELFKSHKVVTGDGAIQKIFSSSGTTGLQTSRHYITDLSIYETNFTKCFHQFFGDPVDYCLLALLPSYLEREDSSLVYMTMQLAGQSNHPMNGFFLNEYEILFNRLVALEKSQQKTLLIGVSFALLDFAHKFPCNLKHTRIMETGGMKGRGAELTRKALHELLKQAFGLQTIYSEYGMTELLSQAYMMEDGKFHAPSWMKILIRDVNDPLQLLGTNAVGAINIIDLANLDSCAFIATADLGKTFVDGTFETLGRTDYSDIRGCNLLWDNQVSLSE